jgi:puromycin-sensitive aminopeptidase
MDFQRLPCDVVPKKYHIALNIDLKEHKFSGNETIEVLVNQSTDRIVLNACNLEVKKALFNDVEATITLEEQKEVVIFTFPSLLNLGPGKLYVEFGAALENSMKGLYLSKYVYNGETKYLATTQFEPTDARRAFPCWDEPSHKATFEINITAEKHFTVLSNTVEVKREPVEGSEEKEMVFFQETPIMSTYLVAFVVGEFEYVETHSADGVLVRVFTSLGNKEKGRFALDIAARTLPFYKEYFDCSYPLPKLDLIAIPDFAAGAMENWGLVTYRETALLVDPKETSAAGRQRVAVVVGHELAHQWFGNLVTMEWWTHLWLNEGFASWIEYLCVDYCCPDYDIWTQFIASDFADALEMDSLKTSHPIEVEVNHPREIDDIFDRISYSKGASIIRMLQTFMGAEVFKRGLQIYLNRHKYSNAKTEDLWAALEQACDAKLNVGEIMRTWTSQMGYPVISVQKGDSGERSLKFSQTRFIADGSEDATSLWHVPIVLCAADDPAGTPLYKFVLKERETEITLPDNIGQSVSQLRVNPLRYGFYRVHYCHPDMFSSVCAHLNQLSAIDRLSVQNDVFALSRAGRVPLADFMKLLPMYSNEKDYTVWADLSGNLRTIHILVEELGSENVTLYHRILVHLLDPVFKHVGWVDSECSRHTDQLLRGLVLTTLGKVGHPPVLEEGRQRFALHCQEKERIASDLRMPVYSMVMRHGDRSEFEQILTLFSNSDLQEEKVRLVRALGNAPLHILPDVHEFALNEDKVRKQDMAFVLLGCCADRESRRRTWAFVKEKWTPLCKALAGLFLFNYLIKGLVEDLASEDMYDDVKSFVDSHSNEPGQQAFRQSLENLQVNIRQLERERQFLQDWLKSFAF